MKKLLFIILFAFFFTAYSAELIGRVVGVADGDTVTVFDDSDRKRFRIRLAGIDAPEKKQPFGQKAKQYLSSLIFGKTVIVKFSSRDRYGRIIGTIYLNGKDISLAMLSAGLAWHYSYFDNTPEYAEAEKKARSARIGLWSDPHPIHPRKYRISFPE